MLLTIIATLAGLAVGLYIGFRCGQVDQEIASIDRLFGETTRSPVSRLLGARRCERCGDYHPEDHT